MTDDMKSLRDDIAFLKSMAEGGRDGGGEGGWILISAGALYGLASIAQWAALERLIPSMLALVAWVIAMVLFFVSLFVTRARTRREGGRSRAAGLAWQAVGFSLFIIFAAIALATWRTQSPLLINLAPCIVMALYGGAWSVAAVVTGRRWLWATTFGSFAAALISAWMISDHALLLVYAGALFLLAFVPGLVFVLGERGHGE